jgi:hypothetical protein
VAKKPELPAHIQASVDQNRARNQMLAAIRGTQWGKDTTPEQARYVVQYCRDNGLDPVRHVELLGGRIYLTAELYDEKGVQLIRDGIVNPDEPDYINADARLDVLAAEGDAWAIEERMRRIRLRIQFAVPEAAAAAVVQRFHLAGSGKTIVGVNWCGGGVRGKTQYGKEADPIGEAEPAKTAQTRARRRAWRQIAEVVPGYAAQVRPLEAAAKIVSEQMPIAVIEAPRGPKALAEAPLDAPYGNAVPEAEKIPVPPAQHSDDPALAAEDLELPL